MLLEGKSAVIYGAGGSIGGEVARTFAREGARVFLAGRTRDKLEAVAADTTAAGGQAEVAEVDALDEQAVDQHADAVAAKAGSLDISFNLITRGDVQGTPLVDMTTADFVGPITTWGHGGLHHRAGGGPPHDPAGSRRHPGAGQRLGAGQPDDGRHRAGRCSDRHLHPQPGRRDRPPRRAGAGHLDRRASEILTPEKLAAVNRNLQLDDAAFQGLLEQLDGMRMLRSPRLAQVAAAAFLASDQAATITGTFVNVTSGTFPS
jgi:short chain dehydrogenase